MQNWREGKVIHGDKTGRTLGFPTANFDPALADDIQTDGIYACKVVVNGVSYKGALYLAPRLTLGETKRVLEIYLLDFDGDLYDQTVRFRFGPFIRPARDFTSVESLKKQLADDIAAVRRTLV